MAFRSRRKTLQSNYVDLDASTEELYGIKEKLESTKFQVPLVKEMCGEGFSLKYFQEHGFAYPLRFVDMAGLGMAVPDAEKFSVKSVCKLVGKEREIYVQCCKTQTTLTMSMDKFTQYYLSGDRTEIYNVLSLEFSDTKMDQLVHRPAVVNGMDWIDLAFPGYLKKLVKKGMYYPKVQKYCLMSVGGSYTTFHIDFGGTSVWYHVLKGKKIFWLIEPTDENLQKFEKWNATNDDSVFLGDLVDKCQRVELEAGTTFMIPSGWIHAVYTPVDSLVFGGNFLHSFSIPMQQSIVEMEDRTKVPQKQRFPLLRNLLWFVLERYVCSLTGQSYLNDAQGSLAKSSHSVAYLTGYEIEGLAKLVDILKEARDVDQIEEMDDLKRLHRAAGLVLGDYQPPNDPQLAITGKPVINPASSLNKRLTKSAETFRTTPIKKAVKSSKIIGKKRRMVSCKQCEACLQPECKKCLNCLDMVKNGGPGLRKRPCVMRGCTNKQPPKPDRSKIGGKRQHTATEVNTNPSSFFQDKQLDLKEEESDASVPAPKKICGIKVSKIEGGYQSSPLSTDGDPMENKDSNEGLPLNNFQVSSNIRNSSSYKIGDKYKKRRGPKRGPRTAKTSSKRSTQEGTREIEISISIKEKPTAKRTYKGYNRLINKYTATTTKPMKPVKSSFSIGKKQRRMVPCKQCEACLQPDCRKCLCCMDMIKYGGPGKWKKTCEMRKCTNKQPPKSASPKMGRKRKRRTGGRSTNSSSICQDKQLGPRKEERDASDSEPTPTKICGIKLSKIEGSYQSSPLSTDDNVVEKKTSSEGSPLTNVQASSNARTSSLKNNHHPAVPHLQRRRSC